MLDSNPSSRLERLLAILLLRGTWLASAVIAAGLAAASLQGESGRLNLADSPGMTIVSVGIALLILLPVLRVAVMLGVFLQERDYRFGAIAALVLAIIVLGIVVGALSA